jgi:Zn-dependent protease
MLNRPIEQTVALVLALIPAFAVHEFAHAWAAYRLGDPTAKNQGRLTLNPLKHLDVLGTLMVLVAGFGWAKPVPVNPYNLRYGRFGMALVAVVGPLSNLLMAVAVAVVWRALGFTGGALVVTVLGVFISLNVVLLFFNLIPVSPLDGFKVLVGVLPEPLASRWARTAQTGPLLLLGLIVVGSLVPGLDILGRLIWGPTQAVVGLLLG